MNRSFEHKPSAMLREQFVSHFGGIYEHASWVAERVADSGIKVEHDTVDGLAHAMAVVVDQAGKEQQLALIRAHPDLAGRAAIAGELTQSSTDEQSRAGLDQCTATEYEQFQTMNEAYKARFDMPFIKAVRHSNRREILEAFESRLGNTPDGEFHNAIREIHQIARWRLEAMTDG